MFSFGPARRHDGGRRVGTDVDTAELLAGRVAIVSGVGPGPRTAHRLALARAGADVGLGARRAAPLERVAAEIEDLGRRSCAVPTDVTDPDQCQPPGGHRGVASWDASTRSSTTPSPRRTGTSPSTGSTPARWRAPMDGQLPRLADADPGRAPAPADAGRRQRRDDQHAVGEEPDPAARRLRRRRSAR